MATKPTNEIEQLVDVLTQSLVAEVESFPEAPIPYRAVKLSRREQMRDYTLMRGNEEAWRERVRKHGWGPAVRYAQVMDKRLESAFSDATALGGE